MDKLMLICAFATLGIITAVNNELRLWNSATTGDKAGVAEALNNSANPDWKNPKKEGMTALHTAAEHNYFMILRSLLDAGADKNIRDNKGRTAIFYASQNNSFDALAILISRGADVNIPAVSDDDLKILRDLSFNYSLGHTALHAAAEYNYSVIARLLLAAGADKNARAQDGATPVHIASLYGSIDVLSVLLSQGAKVNILNDEVEVRGFVWSASPLIAAAMKGHLKAVEMLINAHADVNMTTKHGGTALIHAAEENRTAIVKLLLENGADTNQRAFNRTAAEQARSQGYNRVADMIDGIPFYSTTTIAAPDQVLLISTVIYGSFMAYNRLVSFRIL